MHLSNYHFYNPKKSLYSKPIKGLQGCGEDYRFHFNGKEKDDETQTQDYGFRIYDYNLARFLSVDPLTESYPWYTPYQFAGNMPIKFIDLDGLEPAEPGTEKGQLSTETKIGSENKRNYTWKWNGDSWQNQGQALKDVLVSSKNNLPSTVPNVTETPAVINDKPSVPTLNKTETPWMNTALKELNSGVKEVPKGSNSGPKVDVYLKYAGVTSPNAWCASFAHWCLGQNGIKGAGAKGENWLKWGVKLQRPKYGAVVVFKTNHIGFFMAINADGKLKILHGNWSDKVKISSGEYDPIYPKDIKEYRFPENY